MYKWLYCLLILTGCSSYTPKEKYFNSYLDLRYEGVVRQQLDMSCGLAALSDVLQYRYNEEVYEYHLLEKIEVKPRYSFADIQVLASIYGKKAIPLWMTYDNLLLVNGPAIFYLERKGKKHFVSLLYIDKNTIQLKDPAWGVINYTRTQFEDYWITTSSDKGKVLVFVNGAKESKKREIDKKLVVVDL